MPNRPKYEKSENVRTLGESNQANLLDFLQEASQHQRDTRENVRTLGESNRVNQVGSLQELDLVQEKAQHQGDRQKNLRPLDDSDEEQVKPLKKRRTENLLDFLKSGRNKRIHAAIDQLRSKYKEQLEELQKKRAKFECPKKIQEKRDQPSPLKTLDGYSYQKSIEVYRDTLTGELTRAFTITIKQGDGAPVETTTPYSGEAADLARLCSEKLDGFIQNNYHDALAQAKLKIEEETEQAKLKIEEETEQAKKQIEEEMAPQYAALETTPDPAARARLDAERTQKMAELDTKRDEKIAELDAKRGEKIAEVGKKASAGLRKFLEKHGGRRLDSELLEELQWVQGMEAAARDIKGRIAGAENKLETSAENLQRITTEINDKIQEIQRLLPSSESHALAGSSEASDLSHRPLTLENFDQKIAAYMKDSSRGLSDPIYKDLLSLADHARNHPESIGEQNRLKISKTLIDIGRQLIERQYKLDEPFEMLEKWERYTASHYGKRLMYERQLIDHFQTVSEAAGEHAKAAQHERDMVNRVDILYRAGARKVDHHPFYPGFNNVHEQVISILKKIIISDKITDKEPETLSYIYKQIQSTLENKKKGTTERTTAEQATAEEERAILDNVRGLLQRIDEQIQSTLNKREIADEERAILDKLGQQIQSVLKEIEEATHSHVYEQFLSTLDKLKTDDKNQDTLSQELKDLMEQAPAIFQANSAQQLQNALKELEQARLASLAKKGEYDKALAQKERIQKLVDLEKGRDDANDALDLNKVNAIKETDKASLQHLRTLELEMVKHFYARRLEDHKMLNKEEEAIRHFLITLDKMEIGNEIQQKRITTMYWLALFGSGDQAALISMTRDANTEFNAYMGQFR
jgi:hypothetical protein